MRLANFAGKLYNHGYNELSRQIETFFENGPGDLPLSLRNKDIKGIIAPSASYPLSGNLSAWAYKEIGESKFPELFILLGDTKFGRNENKAYLSLKDFATPFGIVKNAGMKSDYGMIAVDENVHENEPCLELQLPFLQFVCKERMDRIKIMPLLFDKCNYETLVNIANMIKSIKKSYIIITSSSLISYGKEFNFTPFRYNIREEVKEIDLMLKEFICKLNSHEFLEYASKHELNVSSQAIFVMLEVLKGKVQNGKELMYGNSGDATEDYENFITYSSFVFQ